MGWIHSEAATISPLFRFRAPSIFILPRPHAITSAARRAYYWSSGCRPQRQRSADALPSAARRTCLLGINGGEQLLHGTRRRYAERLVEVNRLCKLLSDEVIAPREFGVVRERLLNAIGVAAAQRPRRMPRQQGLDLVSLFLIHSQSRSIPFALRRRDVDRPAMPGNGTASADAPEQQDAARSGRDQGDGAPFPAVAPVNPEMFGSDLTCSRTTPCQHPSLVIAPRLRPLAERPRLLRRCALFATGGEPNEVAPTSGAM